MMSEDNAQPSNVVTDLELRQLRAAQANHIWLNALRCVNPTVEFKVGLADVILEWLNDKERLFPSFDGPLGELTPKLFLSINKS